MTSLEEISFVHLRLQSSYSLLKSSVKIADIVSLAKQNNSKSVCLSDKDQMFGSLEFASSAIKESIRPIHGLIQNVEFTNKRDQTTNKRSYGELLFIAQNEVGYSNLLKLNSLSHIENDQDDMPHITIDDILKYNEGIICLSGYDKGIIGKLLLDNKKEEAKAYAIRLNKIFDNNRFYFEIMRHNLISQKKIEHDYIKLADELSLPLVATNNVLFPKFEDHNIHDVLLCISEGKAKEDPTRARVSNQCYYKSDKEMKELFVDLPDAIENSFYISQRCSFHTKEHKPSLPKFSEEFDESELLNKEASSGLEARLGNMFKQNNITDTNKQNELKEQYFDRLKYELDIICKMDFAGYFLIVSDFIKWSKKNNIAVGPGRGSGAGSIIAWSLYITDLDPIKFGLLFERFLNPERVSMPDFDIDFCQEKREKVIEYVQNKYGYNRVAQIITFGKMQAKAVVKDVARVLCLPYMIADRITKNIPFNAVKPVTLQEAIDTQPELKDAIKGRGLQGENEDNNELIQEVLSTALALEGLHRHASTHAAGVVIANQDIVKTIPIYKDPGSNILTAQYSMKYAEKAGLVKFDFLGLQTLTVITKTLELLKTKNISINLDSLKFDDKKTFAMLSKGLSTGVFQFESGGIKNALMQLRPDSIEDIIALGALYRPGPMDNIPRYISGKHGLEKIDYLHPLIKDTLKETYGVIIYQEQVMEIAQKLAKYTLGGADLLRRAMGKKVKKEMDAQEEIFVKGAKANNVDPKKAKEIFDIVAKFAGYGFNKSHASAYGVISYITAYLKANFTAEFLIASLNLEMDNSDKINIFLQDAKRFNIKILPPDINISTNKFYTTNNDEETKIIFALEAVKAVSNKFAKHIVDVRKNKGNFTSIIDFLEKIDAKLMNKKSLENLIKSGAFDSLHENRASLVVSLEKLMRYTSSFASEAMSNQFSLIEINNSASNIIIEAKPISDFIKAYQEFEVLGLFIKNHPLNSYLETINKKEFINSDILQKIKDYSLIGDNNKATVNNKEIKPYLTKRKFKIAGVIVKKDIRMSKKGSFVNLILSDLHGIFDITLFNDKIIKDNIELIKIGSVIIVDLGMGNDNRILAHKICDIKNINIDNDDNIIVTKKNDLANEINLYPKDQNHLDKMIKMIKNLQLIVNQQNNNHNNRDFYINLFVELNEDFILKNRIIIKREANMINDNDNYDVDVNLEAESMSLYDVYNKLININKNKNIEV